MRGLNEDEICDFVALTKDKVGLTDFYTICENLMLHAVKYNKYSHLLTNFPFIKMWTVPLMFW